MIYVNILRKESEEKIYAGGVERLNLLKEYGHTATSQQTSAAETARGPSENMGMQE